MWKFWRTRKAGKTRTVTKCYLSSFKVWYNKKRNFSISLYKITLQRFGISFSTNQRINNITKPVLSNALKDNRILFGFLK